MAAAAPQETKTRLLLREKEGQLRLLSGLPSSLHRWQKEKQEEAGEGGGACGWVRGPLVVDDGFPDINSEVVEWSADGRLLACGVPGAIKIVDLEDRQVKCELNICFPNSVSSGKALPMVKALHFSPLGTYLLTWQNAMKPTAAAGGGGGGEGGERLEGNLVVWNVSTGEEVLRTHQKNFEKGSWPTLQWSQDQAVAMRGMPNEIQIYEGERIEGGIVDRIAIPKLGCISVSPGPAPYRVAAFVPELKGKPGRLSLYSYPLQDGPLDSKSTFRAEDCIFRWAPTGKAVLALTSTVVDATGTSYYGATGLFLMHASGEYSASVTPPKEGTIHDVQWAPAGSSARFAVTAGTMPAQTNLHNAHGEAVFQFGQASRNTLCWSPHGRFLIIAGFGNLAGGMDFWEVNKCKKMGTTEAHCAVTYGWSPDSRYFMTATCAPRMNVDNCYQVFGYDGLGPVASEEIGQLFEARWQPALPTVFPDRPVSPGRGTGKPAAGLLARDKAGGAGGGVGGGGGGGEMKPTPLVTKKTGLYKPPGSTGGMAARMRAEREGDTKAKKLTRGAGAAGLGAAGGEGVPPPQSANAKRKAARKKAEAERKEREAAEAAAAAAAPPPPPEPVDPVKRKKQLTKKIRAIEQLVEKQQQGTVELDADQKAKVAGLDALKEELDKLEL